MNRGSATRRIGVVSDTHGLLRPEAIQALYGCEAIVHAGDIGSPQVLEALEAIAPVKAVRGNIDDGTWAEAIPEHRTLELGGTRLYLLHNLQELRLDPLAAGFAGVISGHSHKPLVQVRQGVLYLNPGSIGPRRFRLPVSMAYLHLCAGGIEPELVQIL